LGKILIRKNTKNLFETILIGAIFASFLGLITNFFFPLNPKINSIILSLTIIFFIYKKLKISLDEIKILLLLSLISFSITLFDTVNRPDAYLYHLPYTHILNENKIIIGLSNLHFRYAHISLLQYLSAINYTHMFNQNSILAPLAVLWTVCAMYFGYDIYKLINKKEKIAVGKIFSVLILIYIAYKINRYSEFGNDAIAHLFFFIIVSKFLYYKSGNKFDFYTINLYCAFCISNKIFLGLSILIPSYIFFKEKLDIIKITKTLPAWIILLWIIKNIFVSGCLIFPIKITCSEFYLWTNVKQIERESLSGEAWAKSWPQRNNKKISMEDFNKNFNWIEAWSKIHFKQILVIIIPYFLIIFLLYTYYRGGELIKKDKNKIIFVFLMSLLGNILFFLKFPTYRYGYSYLIILLSIIFINYLKNLNLKRFFYSSKIILILIIIIISSKQMKRYFEYYQTRHPIPLINFNEEKDINKKYKKIIVNDQFHYYWSDIMCMYYLAPCTSQNPPELSYKKVFGYHLLY